MTEDELLFAIATVSDELRKVRAQLRQSIAWPEAYSKLIDRNEAIKRTLLDSLKNLSVSLVVSMAEYKSLIRGLSTTITLLKDTHEKRVDAQKIRNQAALEVSKLEAQLVDFERQLEQYKPPKVVLEFKKNDKR